MSLLLLLSACTSGTGDSTRSRPGRDDTDTSGTDTSDSDTAPIPFTLTGPSVLPLPYVTVGQPAPSAPFTLTAVGDTGSPGDLSVHVDGPFTVDLDTSPMSPGESRVGTLTSTSATSTPGITSGTLTVSAGDQALPIDLASVVGDPAIPAASTS